jgi:hypothetical protein
MSDRFPVSVQVEIGPNGVLLEAVITGYPFQDPLLTFFFDGTIKLGAVAGRKDSGFFHVSVFEQVVQGLVDDIGSERQAFTDTDGGSFVIESESEQRHLAGQLIAIKGNFVISKG